MVELAEQGDAGAMQATAVYNAALTLGYPVIERLCWILDEVLRQMRTK